MRGDIVGAFHYNPLFLVWGLWCLVAFTDLIHKGLAAGGPTIGERCVLAVGRSKVLRVTHIAFFAFMLVYANVIGPTARVHVCLDALQWIHP